MKITARYPWATREIWEWLNQIQYGWIYQFTVTSLYRPVWYNAAVRGLWNSYHLKGRAADIAPDNVPLEMLAARAKTCTPYKGQVVIEAKKGIVHIEIED